MNTIALACKGRVVSRAIRQALPFTVGRARLREGEINAAHTHAQLNLQIVRTLADGNEDYSLCSPSYYALTTSQLCG